MDKDWEQRKLGEVSDITKLAGFEFTKYIIYSNEGNVPAIRGLNVKNGNFDFSDLKYIDNSELSKLSRSKLLYQDIVFTYVGTIGDAALVPKDVNWYLAPNVARIRSTAITPEYLFQILTSSSFKNKEIKKWITSSSQPALSMENIRKFNLSHPKYYEQNKVGLFLGVIDKTIELHQRKYHILSNLYSVFVDKLYPAKDKNTPVLRFHNYKNEWNKTKLESLLEEFTIKSNIENEYQILSSTNSGMEIRNGRVSGKSNKGYKLIENGDLVLSPQNLWLGNININNLGKGLVSPSYKTFHVNRVDGGFLEPQLRTRRMLNTFENVSTQGASVVRRNLDIDLFNQIIIKTPQNNEKEEISKLLKSINDLTNVYKKQIINLQTIKKQYLNKMFL